MTKLYLIRHGEAETNVTPIIGGINGDTGLTRLGLLQAERLRDRLAASGEIAADVLIASTLPRARQTAQIIAPAIGLPIEYDDEVQEMRVGEADGLTITEAEARFGPLNHLWDDPFRPLAPGGENWGQFVLRVGTALDRITRQHQGKTIVVVCHGGVIDNSFVYFFRMNSLNVPQFEFYTHNTSLTQWEQIERNGRLRWRLVKYNDATHLAGITLDQPLPADHEQPAVPLPTEEAR